MKIFTGTPTNLKTEDKIVSGVQIIEDEPHMDSNGEALNVWSDMGKNWYYDTETHEIKQM